MAGAVKPAALVIAVGLLLVGCTSPRAPLTNPEIIRQTTECESAGLRAAMITNLSGEILRIQCQPWPSAK